MKKFPIPLLRMSGNQFPFFIFSNIRTKSKPTHTTLVSLILQVHPPTNFQCKESFV